MKTELHQNKKLVKRIKAKLNTSFYYEAFKIMIFGILFVTFENAMGFLNTFMVGHYLNEAAVVSVGITLPILSFCWATVLSVTITSGVFTAQYLGMKNYEAVRQTVRFKIVVSVPIMILIGLLCTFLSHDIAKILLLHNGTISSDVYNQALVLTSKYLKVIIWNYLISTFVLAIQSTMVSYGKTKFTAFIAFISLVVAATLSPVFIQGLGPIHKLGIIGGALGVIVGHSLEAIALILYIAIKKPSFNPGWKLFKINSSLFWQIIKYWPAVWIAQVMLNLAFSAEVIVFNVFAGPDLVSAASITFAIIDLFYGAVTGYISVIQYYIGRELGAGNIVKARQSALKIIKLAIITTLISAGIYFSTSYWLITLVYAKTLDPRALKLTRWFIRIQTVGYVCEILAICLAEIVRVGNKQIIVSVYESTFFWIFGVVAEIILFKCKVNVKYILLALSFLQLFQILITTLMYRYVKWARKIKSVVLDIPNLNLENKKLKKVSS